MEDSTSSPQKPASLRPRRATASAVGLESEDPFGGGVKVSGWLASHGEAKPQRVSREAAALLLITDTAVGELSMDDALRIVSYMEPKRLRAGAALIRQGERDATHFMALVLDGTIEVVVREGEASHVLGVMGPGSVIGEMSLVDGDARSASCVAIGHVGVGMLTRKALARMMDEEPMLAARLLLIMMRHVTKRLRETTRRLKFTVQLNDALQAELRAHGAERAGSALAAETGPCVQKEPFRAGDTVKLYPRGTSG